MHHRRDLVDAEEDLQVNGTRLITMTRQDQNRPFVLHINSIARDIKQYPDSNRYTVQLATPLANVAAIQLLTASVPAPQCTLEAGSHVLLHEGTFPIHHAHSDQPELSIRVTNSRSRADHDFADVFDDELAIFLPQTVQSIRRVSQTRIDRVHVTTVDPHHLGALHKSGCRLHVVLAHSALHDAGADGKLLIRGVVHRVPSTTELIIKLYRPRWMNREKRHLAGVPVPLVDFAGKDSKDGKEHKDDEDKPRSKPEDPADWAAEYGNDDLSAWSDSQSSVSWSENARGKLRDEEITPLPNQAAESAPTSYPVVLAGSKPGIPLMELQNPTAPAERVHMAGRPHAHAHSHNGFLYVRAPRTCAELAQWITAASGPGCEEFHRDLLRRFDARLRRFKAHVASLDEREEDIGVEQEREIARLSERFKVVPQCPTLRCVHNESDNRFVIECAIETDATLNVTARFGPYLRQVFLGQSPGERHKHDKLDDMPLETRIVHAPPASAGPLTVASFCSLPCPALGPAIRVRLRVGHLHRAAQLVEALHATLHHRETRKSLINEYRVHLPDSSAALVLQASSTQPIRIESIGATKKGSLSVHIAQPHGLWPGDFVDVWSSHEGKTHVHPSRQLVIRVPSEHRLVLSGGYHEIQHHHDHHGMELIPVRRPFAVAAPHTHTARLLGLPGGGLSPMADSRSRYRVTFPAAPNIARVPFVWLCNSEWQTSFSCQSQAGLGGTVQRYWTGIGLSADRESYSDCSSLSQACTLRFHPPRHLQTMEIELRQPDGSLFETQGLNHDLVFLITPAA